MKTSCRKIKTQFSILRDQELSQEAEKGIEIHFSQCSNCAWQWRQYNQTLDTLFPKLEKVEAVPPQVWNRFKQDLTSQKQNWLKELEWKNELIPLKWGGALAFGVAALLFLAILLTKENQIQDLAAQNLLTHYEYGKVLSVL